MASKFNLEIITPKKIVLKEEVELVILRTVSGDMGILANHAPFVSELVIGEMKIKKTSTDEEIFYISGGFLNVSREKTLILADEAMNVKDINLEREKREAELAKAKLDKLEEDKDIALTERALQEALTKVKLTEKHL